MSVELVLELRQLVIQVDEWRLCRLEHERRVREPEASLVPTRVLLVVTCVHLHQVLQQVRVVVLETKTLQVTTGVVLLKFVWIKDQKNGLVLNVAVSPIGPLCNHC